MLAEQADSPPVTHAKHRADFFRQSGWLMIANVGAGAMMWAVHFLSKAIPEGEYGSFGTFLAVVMVLPTMPLQMILAQQTAKALAHDLKGELSGVIRLAWGTTFLLWLVAAIVVLVLQQPILNRWHMTSPVGLWLTLGIVLLSIWVPMFAGVLQGQQNFLWLGWSMLLSAFGRVAVAALAVLVLHTYAAGMLGGVLFGVVVAFVIAVWQSRALWLEPSKPCDWRGLLRQILPLTLGFLGVQILFTADTMFVKAFFTDNEAGFYVSAGTLSRALMWLVLPLAAVMFPRIVQSAAKSEKTNLMGAVLIGTAILAVLGAVSLSILGPWVVRLVFRESYVQIATALLPWYAFAMVPLALANVLINNLLARPSGQLVPGLCIFSVAAGYLVALSYFHDHLVTVVQVLGTANLALLVVCAWFTWGAKAASKVATAD